MRKARYLPALAAFATVIGAIATLGQWLFPHVISGQRETVSPVSPIEKVDTAPALRDGIVDNGQEELSGTSGHVPQNLGKTAEKKILEEPLEFSLYDREQRVILAGCAALAVQFNEVAGEDLLTLRINVGDESTPYAILSTGERIRFDCHGRYSHVSILSIDNSERLVKLRVDSEL